MEPATQNDIKELRNDLRYEVTRLEVLQENNFEELRRLLGDIMAYVKEIPGIKRTVMISRSSTSTAKCSVTTQS